MLTIVGNGRRESSPYNLFWIFYSFYEMFWIICEKTVRLTLGKESGASEFIFIGAITIIFELFVRDSVDWLSDIKMWIYNLLIHLSVAGPMY